ncbi:MAG TPA: bifunctional 5,10-methylenetetrahydrofolate dehydrogenase/5,10-methenyltetrahydrofolate cyclohydrolase [Candidatus Dojkabacteria bacterium]|nr:bifunctional 5,10-methylenetetrahydrofolate dehydrogenase/5,10-methenyltetrahydrofolate cyclohydrolase [Candidatus Dojkabacteria bacterium]
MKILDGKRTSQKILDDISSKVERIVLDGKRTPRLDLILVGEDFASIKYVQIKEQRARELGIDCQTHHLGQDSTTEDVVNLIKTLNAFDEVDGFMVQLPLPVNIDTNTVLESIEPRKDVDGLTSVNLGRLFQNDPKAIPPATPLGIVRLLEEYGIEVSGKKSVILGASNIVGVPLSAMLLRRDSTVTICNSSTVNIQEVAKTADILISATGVPLLVKSEFLKEGAVVIDVGSNKHPETGKLVGDVDWEDVQGIPSYITPVPGGVGPMTVASLMLNLMDCYEQNER